MLKISDFSKISQVSTRTLRLYDELGLLKPVQVDKCTNYRYYSLEQLPQLNQILALRDFGFSLEQIARLLKQNVSLDELQRLLWLKQAELKQHVQAQQARLARIEARLKQIEREDKMPEYEVVLKKVEQQMVVSGRMTMNSEQQKLKLTEEVEREAQQHGLKEIGPLLYLYHHLGYREEDADVEVAFPVEAETLKAGTIGKHSEGWIHLYQLPGLRQAACLLYEGDTNAIFAAYQAIGSWIHTSGYQITGPCREVYLQPDKKQVRHIIEIQFPIEKI